ncbi:MAG: alpha/beta hydrolase [Peptococcaceae bacterium]|nr:alpha/beta hydrolase [Peptococcaceae bacterium]
MDLYVEVCGNMAGPTMVFIHGGGLSSWMWAQQFAYFKDYHCLAPDLPEHGKSINAGQISLRDGAQQIARLIELQAHGGKAFVIGHSLGAKILVELLNLRPELVSRAVVASALCRPVPSLKLLHKPIVYRLTHSMLQARWIAELSIKQFALPDKNLNNKAIREFQVRTADSYYRIYDQLYQNLTLPSTLAAVNVPTLVVAGAQEMKAMRTSVADMVQLMPQAIGILLKNGQHNYPWVMADKFNALVDAWITNKPIDNDWVLKL